MSSAYANGIQVEHSEIAPDLRLGADVRIRARELQIGAGVSIEAGVVIEAERVVLAAGSHIAHGVRIAADTFELGLRSRIESECRLAAVGGAAQHIRFGDHCMFGASNIALVPELLVGDYVKIHNHTLINGLRPCYIGHNTWVGQNCVLNANDVLFIGNNVGIGTYTSIWTHAFFGELLEGSQVFSVAPTIIEDSAWLVGAYNVVSPGLRIGKQAMVLTSSVVAKSIAPGHTVAGVPARDVTDRIPAVRQVPAAERLDMMRRFVREFVEQVHPGRHSELADGHRVQPAHGPAFDVIVRERLRDQDVTSATIITLAYALADERSVATPNVSYFDLITKAYDKRSSEPEIQIISFMTTYRARFVPRGLERVGSMPVLPAEAAG